MSLPFPRSISLVVAACAALLLLVAEGASAEPVVHKSAAGSGGYWSPERIAAAKPLPLPLQKGGAPAVDAAVPAPLSGAPSAGIDVANSRAPQPPMQEQLGLRGKNPPFSSGAVPQAEIPTFPTRTNGRLVGVFKKIGPYSCSATVVDTASDSVILTAGHCIHDRKVGFARKVAFVPAYDDGAAPFGAWQARYEVVPKRWAKFQIYSYDYAAVKLESRNGTIGSVVGESGLAWNQPRRQKFRVVGYPVNRGKSEVMWNCSTRFARLDINDHRPGKPDSGVGCDMKAGASGGGWSITDSGETFVNSVTSFGYRSLKKILFGPYLTRKVLGLVNKASRH